MIRTPNLFGRRLFVEPRFFCGGSAPSAPDPTVAAIAGLNQTTADYPFSYLVNAAAQTGSNATLTNPATGLLQNYNFTGLGTADVQNTVSAQMSQVLLDIQQGLGSQYIAQRLKDLQQSDPTGYAAYGQLFDQIQQEAAANPPDMPLSQATQTSINSILQSSGTLTPTEMSQVENQSNAGNVASGVYLGNAPAQATANAAVNATDQQQNQAESAASQYLQQGTTPSDIQFRTTQQNLSNLGAFINGQNPTAQFASLSGSQQGAAPNPNTGYTPPTLNEGQAAATGINNANQGFAYQNELSNASANPYLAGLNIGIQGLSTALGTNPLSSSMTSAQMTGLINQNPYYTGQAQLPGAVPIGNADVGGAGSVPAYTGDITGESGQ